MTGTPAPRRPLAPEDLLRFQLPGDPQVSPDGQRVAYTVQTVDGEKNEYRSRIWLAGGPQPPRPLTNPGEKSDRDPRWSPDGRRLAFLSDRSGKPQIWLLDLDGGEACQVTRLKQGAGAFAWAPDGRHLACVAALPPAGVEPEGPEPEEPDLLKKHTRGVRRYSRLPFKKDGTGLLEDRWEQICVVPAGGGPVRQLTTGEWHHADPAWSPDGTHLAFAANRDPEAEHRYGADIWVVPVAAWLADPAAAPPEPVRLTPGRGNAHGPAWSPDGATLAYLGDDRPARGSYVNTRIWLVPADGSGGRRCLTEELDIHFDAFSLADLSPAGGVPLAWTAGGGSLLAGASVAGTVHLLEIDARTGRARQLTRGDRVVYSASFSADRRRAALGVASATEPGDIYLADLPAPPTGAGDQGRASAAAGPDGGAMPGAFGRDGGLGVEERRLTAANAALLSEVHLALPRHFRFRSPGGPECDGWVLPPAGLEPGRRYPTLLLVHGGPQAQYAPVYCFEFQLHAGRGYAVVFTNPRGSLGYGEDFCAAIRHAWGTVDYADVMAGLDAAASQFDFVDPERLGVEGGSYGGYMTNWIVSHTDRFRAAVTMRSVVDLLADVGSCDVGYQDVLHGGAPPPWADPDFFLRQSPITFAGQINTPLLIEAQEEDHRCPMHHQEELLVALRLQRKTAEFHRYPGESHAMVKSGKPWHRILRLKNICAWWDRFLNPPALPPSHL